MIRRDFHDLWEKHKRKIYILLGIIAIILFFVILFQNYFSVLSDNKNKSDDLQSSYQPTKTVIDGSDVKTENHEKNANTIDEFMKYCNEKNIESAYGMLTDECKNNIYPTIDRFNKLFFSSVFSKNREYNIQSWINNSKYTTYRLRITDNILATGNYDSSVKYETYITTYKNENSNKISLGDYMYTNYPNKQTKTDILEATIIKQNIYISDEEYEIKIKNISDKTVLLDNLNDSFSIRLVTTDGNAYELYKDKLFVSNMQIEPEETRTIKLKFQKSASIDKNSSYIRMKKIIKDYNAYNTNPESYNEERAEIDIKIK